MGNSSVCNHVWFRWFFLNQQELFRSRKKQDNKMKLIGFCIATVGVFSFFTGNFIFGAILFFVGTGMMPDY